jgi:stage III sporulation protein SpoIIIAA
MFIKRHLEQVIQNANNAYSVLLLTGPRQVGKTTLLRLILLALKPTRGFITLFGQDASTLDKDQITHLRRRIGFIQRRSRNAQGASNPTPAATIYPQTAVRAPAPCRYSTLQPRRLRPLQTRLRARSCRATKR